jgi:hypothetical protein
MKKISIFLFIFILSGLCITASAQNMQTLIPSMTLLVHNPINPDDSDENIDGIVFTYRIEVEANQPIEGFQKKSFGIYEYKQELVSKDGRIKLPEIPADTPLEDTTLNASIDIQGYQCPNQAKIIALDVYKGCNITFNQDDLANIDHDEALLCVLNEGLGFGNTISACKPSKRKKGQSGGSGWRSRPLI